MGSDWPPWAGGEYNILAIHIWCNAKRREGVRSSVKFIVYFLLKSHWGHQGFRSLRNILLLSSIQAVLIILVRTGTRKRSPCTNENAHPRVDGVENSPNSFDLDLCDLDPSDLDIGLPFLKLGRKLGFLHFWPHWPWPSNLSEIWWSIMCVANFRCIGPMVQPAERKQAHTKTQTHTHRRTLPKILPLLLTREVKMYKP